MPNYVRNILRVVSDDKKEVNKVFDSIRAEDRLIDFNKIIPCAKSLEDLFDVCDRVKKIALYMCRELFNPSLRNEIVREYDSMPIEKKEAFTNEARVFLHNIAEYGHGTGYRWRLENWNTKWNACSTQRMDENTLCFETAWSVPTKVFVALSQKFPNIKFECRYADEDTGYNCGRFSVINGEFVDEFNPKGGSNEAYEFSLSIWKEFQSCYKLTENGYVSVDEEE